MNKILLASTALVLAGTTVQAADIAPRMYTKAPAPIETYGWTGFYMGLNAGAGWTNADVTTTNTAGVAGIFGLPANIAAVNAAGTGGLNSKAVFSGGGQAGYNWQVQRTVWGIEADINSLARTANLVGVAATTNGPLTVSTGLKTDYLATFRGRFGFLLADQTLLYVTGGAAVTDVRLSQNVAGTLAVSGVVTGAAAPSTTKVGWTVGGGFEQAFAPNWSVKGEYLYARFDGVGASYVATAATTGSTQNITATTGRIDEQVARVGINYRFGGPVVARY